MKRIGMIGTLLLVALLVLGVGFARWSDTLTIGGRVNTGSLKAEFDEVGSWDSEPEGKDYSSIECVVDEDDPSVLHVTITNGYPSIDYYNAFDIVNSGTIPLHVDAVTVNRGNLPQGATVEVTKNPTGDLVSSQLHPNKRLPGVIKVHLGSDTAMNGTYTFSATLAVGQWNIRP